MEVGEPEDAASVAEKLLLMPAMPLEHWHGHDPGQRQHRHRHVSRATAPIARELMTNADAAMYHVKDARP